MDIIKSLTLAFLLLFSAPALANELPVDLIQDADDMRESSQQAISLCMIEPPDQEWIDMVTAYYFALNIAWAYENEEAYKEFYRKIEELYEDLVADAIQYEETEAPKTEL